jgi:hypothetical protein
LAKIAPAVVFPAVEVKPCICTFSGPTGALGMRASRKSRLSDHLSVRKRRLAA